MEPAPPPGRRIPMTSHGHGPPPPARTHLGPPPTSGMGMGYLSPARDPQSLGLPNGPGSNGVGGASNLTVPEIRYGPTNSLYQGRNRPRPPRVVSGIPHRGMENAAFEPDYDYRA